MRRRKNRKRKWIMGPLWKMPRRRPKETKRERFDFTHSRRNLLERSSR